MASREHLARAMWTLFEPIHAVTYFSDQARRALADIGLERYWDGYFAGRSSPLGIVPAESVIAMFSGFAPFLVHRALPAAWTMATPAQVIEARYVGAAGTLRAIVPDAASIEAAADALTPLAANLDTIGRPLSAAYAALPLEDDPYRRLWQVAGTLREHRGDGHVIALASLGIGGITTLLLRTGVDLDEAYTQKARGWTDEEWTAEADRLIARGLLGADRRTTEVGIRLLAEAERLTNSLATGPLSGFADAELLHIAATLAPIARTLREQLPDVNPIGLPQTWDPESDPDARMIPLAPGD
jgi:hypothetical protein